MSINWNKFVGIKWGFNQSSFEFCDCIGLVKLIYHENGWKPTFEADRPINKDWYKKEPYRLLRYLIRHFQRVDEISLLEEGDIVYFRVNGEGHIGCWLGYGKVLHIPPAPEGSNILTKSYIDRFRNLERGFVCGFRRRPEHERIDA